MVKSSTKEKVSNALEEYDEIGKTQKLDDAFFVEQWITEIKKIQEPAVFEEGAHKCRKCKSKNTITYLRQTRSADEPMTEFMQCKTCGFYTRLG